MDFDNDPRPYVAGLILVAFVSAIMGAVVTMIVW